MQLHVVLGYEETWTLYIYCIPSVNGGGFFFSTSTISRTVAKNDAMGLIWRRLFHSEVGAHGPPPLSNKRPISTTINIT